MTSTSDGYWPSVKGRTMFGDAWLVSLYGFFPVFDVGDDLLESLFEEFVDVFAVAG